MECKLFYLVLAAVVVGICNAAYLNTNELEARRFVQNADEKISKLMENVSSVMLVLEDTPSWQLEGILDMIMNAAEAVGEIVRDSFQFDTTMFKDKELKHIFEQLKPLAEEGILGRYPLQKLLTAVNYLEALSDIKNIPKYSDHKIRLRYFPDVQNIIAQSNDTKELEYYWTTFRDKNSRDVLWRFLTVSEVIIEAAGATNMSPLEFWMKGYNLTEMERLMNETQPLYVQLHGFIRHQLLNKYGDSVIKADGPIPDHLFQQVLAQAWTNGSIIDDIFPHEKLPLYNEVLEQKNFNALDLYKNANDFYHSLGFESDPEDLFESRIKISKNRDEGDCKPLINDGFKNVSLKVCKRVDFRTFLQAHWYMGRIYYAIQKRNQPTYYLESYHLEYPVGEAIILSASTLSHLKTIGLMPDVRITDEIQFNRLFRMAIHTLLNIPIHYAQTKAMADLFQQKVEFPFLNKHYWSLMNQFAGVEPPNDRVSSAFDFSYKFFIAINENRQAKKFYSEILGYQIYKRLCQISGDYVDGKLYECDFYGSKKVGDVLKKMMELGSSKPLNVLLETTFPNNSTITADSLLEYYSPIKDFLIQMNQQNKVELGWKQSTKVVKRVIVESDEEYDD